MSANDKEQVITVPADLTRRCKGIAIDMGGSVQKYVYRTKEDQDEISSEDVKYGHLHVTSFCKRQLDEALEYVRHRAVLTTNGPEPPSVYTTGMGCSQYGRQICQQLNIKLEQVTEFDCFLKSFVYLASQLPRTELLEPFLEDATVDPLEQCKTNLTCLQQIQDQNLTQCMNFDLDAVLQGMQVTVGRPSAAALEAGDVPLAEAEPDIFPCVLAMCGSGFGLMKIEKDGSFKVIDGSNRSGKAFVAIGSLLSGAESYEELMELAAVGVQRNVDQFSDQLVDRKNCADGDDSFYTLAENLHPGLIFCFGNALGAKPGDLRREDLARAWLNYVVLDLVQMCHYVCTQNDVKRVFFCGGFCNHPLVRQLITTEFVRRNLLVFTINPGAAAPQFDFIKPGAYLGALGCLINDLEKFTGK